MHKKISKFCSDIGKNKLLVQGSGGNVSWKENDILNVKASGTRMGDALYQDIFVSVNLKKIKTALSEGQFNIQFEVLGKNQKKPSIETMLHAIMPHTIVVHLHMVEILAHILKENFNFSEFLDDFSFAYEVIDYIRPGPSLAKAICFLLKDRQFPDVIFLKNHGVVIGGSDLKDIKNKISTLEKKFKTINQFAYIGVPKHSTIQEYTLIEDQEIQKIVFNGNLYSRLDSSWALYPDHVVFLGPIALTFDSWDLFLELNNKKDNLPELIFIKNQGVYCKKNFSEFKLIQLQCYVDIISRIDEKSKLCVLDAQEINFLINWEEEKYRLSISL